MTKPKVSRKTVFLLGLIVGQVIMLGVYCLFNTVLNLIDLIIRTL